MLKPHLSYIAAISVHRRTSGYPWRGGLVRSNFQCRLLYLKTYGGSREVVEDGRSLLNSWRWSLGWYKWGVKCTDPNSRTSVFWTTLYNIFAYVFTSLMSMMVCVLNASCNDPRHRCGACWRVCWCWGWCGWGWRCRAPCTTPPSPLCWWAGVMVTASSSTSSCTGCRPSWRPSPGTISVPTLRTRIWTPSNNKQSKKQSNI